MFSIRRWPFVAVFAVAMLSLFGCNTQESVGPDSSNDAGVATPATPLFSGGGGVPQHTYELQITLVNSLGQTVSNGDVDVYAQKLTNTTGDVGNASGSPLIDNNNLTAYIRYDFTGPNSPAVRHLESGAYYLLYTPDSKNAILFQGVSFDTYLTYNVSTELFAITSVGSGSYAGLATPKVLSVGHVGGTLDTGGPNQITPGYYEGGADYVGTPIIQYMMGYASGLQITPKFYFRVPNVKLYYTLNSGSSWSVINSGLYAVNGVSEWSVPFVNDDTPFGLKAEDLDTGTTVVNLSEGLSVLNF